MTPCWSGAAPPAPTTPTLTVRDIGASHQPIRIVLDSRLATAPPAALGQTAGLSGLDAAHRRSPRRSPRRLGRPGRDPVGIASDNGQINPRAALQTLAAQGLTRIFCEGGGRLPPALIRAHLVDDLALFTAGALIGTDGQPSLAALNLTALKDAPRLTLREIKATGPDAYSLWSF